jgi:putative peptidoglycan lipid II flippase
MLLPRLSAHAVRGEMASFDVIAHRALRLAVVFAVPFATLAIALAEPFTALLLQRGAFTASSTVATATAITWYAPGVIAMALNHVLARAFQALNALWRLVWTVGAGLLLNVALMPVLTAAFGMRGLAFASSISSFVAVALMIRALARYVPEIRGAFGTRATIVIVLAGIAGGIAAAFTRGLVGDVAVVQAVCGGVVGVVVYVSVLFALAPGEARAALGVLVPGWGSRDA